MQSIRVQPFSRFVNWFQLHVTDDKDNSDLDDTSTKYIYKFSLTEHITASPEEYFIKHDDEFYFLEERPDCKPIPLEGELGRRVIERRFRQELKERGFSFKGHHGYIAYWNRTPYPEVKDYTDIFSAYTGFEFRIIENWNGESNEYYLVIDPHVVFIMQASMADLLQRGSNLTKLENLSVRVTGSEDDERPEGIDGFLLETIKDDNGQLICRIINARTNEEETPTADRVYLEARPEIIKLVLSDLQINFDVIALGRQKSFLNSSSAAKDRFKKTQDIVRDFLIKGTKTFPFRVGNFKVRIEPDLTPIVGSAYPLDKQLPEPSLLFDKSDSSATHLQPYWGLRTFGPFTKNKSEIRLSLLGTKTGIGQLRRLVETMNRGTSIMPNGMRQFFNTKLEIVDEVQLNSESISDCIQGAKALGSRNERRDNGAEVALVHLIEETPDFELDTPYFNVKPILLNYGLASQVVTQPSFRNEKWIHADLASAIFAKARGYPWVLSETLTGFNMIMGIGLSQAISKTRRAGARPRYLGYTNVFDEQGRWMFFESTPQLYDSDNPKEQLASVVSNALERYKQERGYFPRSVSIHYYQRFSEQKIQVVNEVLQQKIGDGYRVAYVTIDESHSTRLYDIQTPDGSFPRAHYAQLSDTEVLLSTTGYTDLAKKRLGTPHILKISAKQYPEPFVSIDEIANQILALTRLNYKTLTPVVREPVTLLFSNLVAKFMANFSETQWKGAQTVPSSKINTVPWFL
ncbi:MAG TPA: Piwi domain-containing protein [Pyrinomonadaceae bacterium]|jgi:hypothetical protein|nr:Piwi domain-containing protein [Pyrinomonadaceae bacterium]